MKIQEKLCGQSMLKGVKEYKVDSTFLPCVWKVIRGYSLRFFVGLWIRFQNSTPFVFYEFACLSKSHRLEPLGR